MRPTIYLVVIPFVFLSLKASGQVPTVVCPIAGVVVLRVDFLASGKIGVIKVEKGPDKLAEQAIKKAQLIKFEPKVVNGKTVDVTRQIEYTFDPFFDKDSPELLYQAIVISSPAPKFQLSSDLGDLPKFVDVIVELRPGEKASVVNFSGEFAEVITSAIRDAARKIKFKPAIHRCGRAVVQTANIRYEIPASR